MPVWRTIYVFVSSTFRDMQAERDVLVKKVFPKLRARLEPYRLRIVEIDLRWGITEAQEKNDEVLELCLDQVERAAPYFLGILGARYGSIPRKITEAARRRYKWLPPEEGNKTSLTEMEILQGVLKRQMSDRRALFYFRSPTPLSDVPESLRSYFVEDASYPAELVQAELSNLAERLQTAGHSASEVLPQLLAGQPEPPELKSLLTPRDRLALVKERLRRAELVRMDGYSWSFLGLRIRWNLARLVLADEQLLEHLRDSASDGVITSEEYLELLREPRLAGFLKSFATVSLDGLELFAQQVEADLWARLELEPELVSAREAAAKAGAATALPNAEDAKKQHRFFAWVKHHFKEKLPAEFDLLPPDQANQLFLLMIERVPEASRLLLNASTLWQDRLDKGGADDVGLAANWDEERDGHLRFAEGRLQVYVARSEVERRILDYLNEPAGRVLVIRGGPGTGKSALLAETWQVCRRFAPEEISTCVAHFVGATPGSGTLLGIVRRLAVELRLISEEDLDLHAHNVDALAAMFASAVSQVDATRNDCVILDALDQIDPAHHAHELHWLPPQLPPNFRLIVSVATDAEQVHAGTVLAALNLRQIEVLDIDEHPFSKADRLQLIQQVPSLAAKSLSAEHTDRLLENPATANPLYLKVALEELRGFGAHQLLMARIREFEPADTPAKLFEQVIEWLSPDFHPDVVQNVLLAIASARHGMSEQELNDFITLVLQPTTESARTALQDEVAALLRYLQPYLQWRGRLLDFHHRALRIAVERRYFSDEAAVLQTHAKLAEMFESAGRASQPLWNDPFVRSIAETVHHRLAARDWPGLLRLMNDETFMFRKGRSPYHHDLATEIARGMSEAPLEFAVALAGAFARFGSQHFALDDIPHNALAQLARQNEARLLEVIPFLKGRTERWRTELLTTSVFLIGTQQYVPAEKILDQLKLTWDGDEPTTSGQVTYCQNLSTLLTTQGRHEEAERICREGIEIGRQIGAAINVALLETTLITVYGALGRHEESAQLTVDLCDRARAPSEIKRVLPRAVYGGFRSLVKLERLDEAERLMREGLDACQNWLGAGLDSVLLATTWADHCLQLQQPEKALNDLRTVLAKTHDEYPEEFRPRLYVLLIRSLLALQRTAEAQLVYKSSSEFPWSERGRQKMSDLLQASRLVAATSADVFGSQARDCAMQGRGAEAETWYLTGLEQFPTDAGLIAAYREFLNANPELAIIEANRSQCLDLMNRIAVALERKSEWDAAEMLYRRAMSQSRDCPDKWSLLAENYAGFLHEYRRDFPAARTLFDKLQTTTKSDSILLTKIAALEISEKNLGDAVSTITEAWSLHANRRDAFAVRIPMLRAFLALALGEDAAIPLGQVKTIVDSGCKLAQWQIPAVLDSLRPQWPTNDVELCQVLTAVLDHPENKEQLATLPRWQQITPVSEKTNW